MKFKMPILLSVTAKGVYCHKQCNGLVDIGEKPDTKFCCSIFGHVVLENKNNLILRNAKCMAASRKAFKDKQILVEALLDMVNTFCPGDDWAGTPIRDNALKAINVATGRK